MNIYILTILVCVLNYHSVKAQINRKYDIKIKIDENINRVSLKSANKDVLNQNGNLEVNSYYLKYNDNQNNHKYVIKSNGNFIMSSASQNKKAIINLGFWNFPKSFDTQHIILSNDQRFQNDNTSIVNLIIDYYNEDFQKKTSYSHVLLFTIPFQNKRDVDSIFPGVGGKNNHHTKFLFILYRNGSGGDALPDKIKGLKLEITYLETGKTKYYEKYTKTGGANYQGDLDQPSTDQYNQSKEDRKVKVIPYIFINYRPYEGRNADSLVQEKLRHSQFIMEGEEIVYSSSVNSLIIPNKYKDLTNLKIKNFSSDDYFKDYNIPEKVYYSADSIIIEFYMTDAVFERTNQVPVMKSENQKKQWSFKLSFYVKGPKLFNPNMAKPENKNLTFPEEFFNNKAGKYFYNPNLDLYNKDESFYKLWKLADSTDFIFYKSDKRERKIGVYRVSSYKVYRLLINGLLPKGEKINYKIETDIYRPPQKILTLKGKGLMGIEKELTLLVPDTLLPNEKITFVFEKPYNFNMSPAGEITDWKEPELIVPANLDPIRIDLQKIKPFQFFYIDISGFKNLKAVKELIKAKIKKGSDYLIFVSNASNPLIYKTGDDLEDLLTRISLMRPEPASNYDEIRYIKPYMDELVLREDRRQAQFNFLFSESFLNHSSVNFIHKSMSKWYDNDELFKMNKIVVVSYSTVEKPSYFEEPDDIDKKKINYIKIE